MALPTGIQNHERRQEGGIYQSGHGIADRNHGSVRNALGNDAIAVCRVPCALCPVSCVLCRGKQTTWGERDVQSQTDPNEILAIRSNVTELLARWLAHYTAIRRHYGVLVFFRSLGGSPSFLLALESTYSFILRWLDLVYQRCCEFTIRCSRHFGRPVAGQDCHRRKKRSGQ